MGSKLRRTLIASAFAASAVLGGVGIGHAVAASKASGTGLSTKSAASVVRTGTGTSAATRYSGPAGCNGLPVFEDEILEVGVVEHQVLDHAPLHEDHVGLADERK